MAKRNKIQKTNEEIYQEILDYINQSEHKKPCTLASIKKDQRTKEIVDLIFSNPNVFRLDRELEHVPAEYFTDDLLVKYILSNPRAFYTIPVEDQTTPVMLAFELAKRRAEYISGRMWGSSGIKYYYQGKIIEYRQSISDMTDQIIKGLDKDIFLQEFSSYIKKASNAIMNYNNNNKPELVPDCKSKYNDVDFKVAERIFILISGYPDSGKTTLQKILSSRINNSTDFDSDNLLNSGKITTSLSKLIKDEDRVVIFSDTYAYNFFSEKELQDGVVINILMQPTSLQKMHDNSKFMSNVPFDKYKREAINPIHIDIDDPIIAQNDYTSRIQLEADKVIEEMFKRLEKPILTSDDIVPITSIKRLVKQRSQ